MKIEWRPITGFEGRYEVSNDGRIRSVGRSYKLGFQHRGTMVTATHELKLQERKGHLFVHVYLGRNRQIRLSVHRVMYQEFIGPIPEGYIVRCSGQLRPENLEAMSRAENLDRNAERTAQWR